MIKTFMVYRITVTKKSNLLAAEAFAPDSFVLRYSPGKSPNDSTLPSKSSSMSDSGVTLSNK